MVTPQRIEGLAQPPHGATARRVEWELLPPWLRDVIGQRLGSPVVTARSAGAGYTPGFASVLTGADDTRQFVKAASIKAQGPFADSYRDEIARLRALPQGLPVPRLLWTYEDDLWVVLALEYVDGHPPARPWLVDELDACLSCLELLADALTPPPMRLPAFAQEFGGFASSWQRVSAGWPHRSEAAALAEGFASATAGTTLVHTDARDDNFLVLSSDGRAMLCDWNWPTVGADWIDTICLLIAAHGDGVDVESILTTRRLTRAVEPASIDALLALLCGYFLDRRMHPTPNSSPHLRTHQSWYAEVTWDWLARRRGWT